MVTNADTVVHPLAVVIESVTTFVADGTVAGLFRSEDFTGRANVALFEILIELEEADII